MTLNLILLIPRCLRRGISIFVNKKLNGAMPRTSFDIETHPYRPEDFTEENPFVNEILKTGIRIL